MITSVDHLHKTKLHMTIFGTLVTFVPANTLTYVILTSYKLSLRAKLRTVGPRSWQYEPSTVWFVQK